MPSKKDSSVDRKLATYKHLSGQRPYKQIAHFLLWAKTALPGVFFNPKQVTRAISGYPPNARVGDDQVKVVKNSMSRAKDYLLGGIGTDGSSKGVIVYDRGLGHRCAVDDDEATEKGMRKSFDRVQSSKRSLARVTKAISQAGISDPNNKRFYKEVVSSSTLLPSDVEARIAELLPAKST